MSRSRTQTRVAIVDGHVLFAQCLEVVLTLRGHHCQRIPLPAPPGTPAALLTAILRARAEVVILDLDLGGWDGVALIEPLARSAASVVVVTENQDRARWGEALLRGARTVLPKNGELSSLTAAIRQLANRAPVMSFAQRHELLRTYNEQGRERRALRARLERLTTRESEVLTQLMAGQQVKEIARACFVSEATVRTQVKAILHKLEVSSQLAAVGVAHRVQWHAHTLAASGLASSRAV